MADNGRLGPPPDTRTVRIELSLRSILSVVAVAAGVWLLVELWQIVLLLVVAVVLAGTLNPLVDSLAERRVPRPIALTAVLLAVVVALVGLVALFVPALVSQVSGLVDSAPAIQERVTETLNRFPPLASQADSLRNTDPKAFLAPVGASALALASAAVEVVALSVTTIVLAFYLIADRERVLGFTYALLPRRFHLRTARILLDMEIVVGGYVRGQALTSLVIGVYVFVVLWLAGTPNPLALALFAAVTDLIPFVGGILVLVPAVLVTLSVGPLPAAIVLGAILAYQEFESRVLVPRIYGQTLRLSPVAVTIALLVGGKLLGIVGALLALPLAAGIRVLIEDLRIDLPGEHTGAGAERAREARAEAVYAVRTAGASAMDAAAVATELAEQLQEDDRATTGQVEVPVEERADRDAPGTPAVLPPA